MISTSKKPNFKPMNKSYVTCKGDVDEGINSCSCQDCKAVCVPPKPIPPPPKPFCIVGVDGWWVIVAILYIAFLVSFLIGVFISCMRRDRAGSVNYGENDETPIIGRNAISEEDISLLERAGAKMEEWLREVSSLRRN